MEADDAQTQIHDIFASSQHCRKATTQTNSGLRSHFVLTQIKEIILCIFHRVELHLDVFLLFIQCGEASM